MSKEIVTDQRSEVERVIHDAAAKITANNHMGYDPADLFTSRFSVIKNLPGVFARLFTLVNFYSPINFRGLLGIVPAQNTTAMVLWGITHQKLYMYSGDAKYLKEIDFAVNWLLEHALDVDGTLGWARVVEYQSRSRVVHQSSSSLTLINAKAADLFLRQYILTKDERYLTLTNKVCQHIVKHTNRINRKDGICLSYINTTHHEVLNASIEAGQILNNAYKYLNDPDLLELSSGILSYTVAMQNKDGSWYYSYSPKDKPKDQIDFHQCYMLDGIQSYTVIPDEKLRSERDRAFIIGSRFYIEKMFDKNMKPCWRYPIPYPIDIHNISHGVYFLSKYCSQFPEYEGKLETLLHYMLTEFYDNEKSYFYYQKYPGFTVKHNFFRWNTMWSLYGLAEYLLFRKKKSETEIKQ